MDYQTITTNAIGMVILFILLLNVRRRYNKEKRDHLVFVLMIIVNMFLCVIEPVAIVLDGKSFEGAKNLLYVLNSLCFIFTILFAFIWSIYAEVKTRNYVKFKGINALKSVPALVIMLLSFINMITPVFFRMNEANEYERILIPYLISYAVAYYYICVGIVYFYKYRRKRDEYSFLPAFTFAIPIMFATAAQFIVGQVSTISISVLWVGSAIGLFSTYVSLVDESSTIDSLSGLLTRYFMDRYIGDLPKNLPGNAFVVGFMLDIDDFKKINDNYGHVVGDDAIKCVGKILRKVIGISGMVFRYAGDEFAIIMILENEEDINRIIYQINTETDVFNKVAQKEYEIKFSIGYTKHIAGEANEEFIARMDSEMYKDKHRRKGIVDEK